MGQSTIQARMQLLQSLNDSYSRATELMIQNKPTTDDEKREMEALMRERDALGERIDARLAEGIKVITKEMEEPIKQISEETARLKSLTNNMQSVKDAIDIIAKIVTIAAKIAAMLA